MRKEKTIPIQLRKEGKKARKEGKKARKKKGSIEANFY